MKISIITVVLNGIDTIARNLESIASQRNLHPEIEHIVIDGGSTDGTLEFLLQHQDQIQILVSEPDNGLYDAMNKGIRLASGDIIGILNADDCYADDCILSNIHDIFEINNVEAVFGDLEYFKPKRPNIRTRLYRSCHFLPSRLAKGLMPAHPTLFLRRTVYDQHGLFKAEYKIAGDFDFIARIFKDDLLNYIYLPKILTRMQTGGVSTRGLKNTILLNQEILRSCRENGISTNFFKLLSRYPRKFLEYIYK